MTTHVKRRTSSVRPVNSGTGGKRLRYNKIQASDLPVIAQALGIEVDDLIETGKRVQQGIDEWEERYR